MRIFSACMLILVMAADLCVAAEGEFRCRSIEAVRTSQPPKIDGVLDDPCWQNAPIAKPFIDSYTSKPAEDQTEAYVLYDEKAIYVAFKCFDSHPDQIIATETKRDGNCWNDDFVEVAIDPFKIAQFFGRNVFKVNAIGTQFTEIRGGRTEKTEWKGDWQAAVSRTDFGWIAEMAIPWEIMDHPSPGKPTTIGINFGRNQVRTRVLSFWSDLGHPFHHEWNGYLVGVVMPKSKVRSLKVLGYSFGGTEPEHKKILRLGADVRYKPNPQLSALLTLNPDFSNVEQEVETIDFSYFPRAYSDKRPFFQEGSEMFRTDQDFFYSRNIKQIDTGLKFYGRMGRTRFGVMDCFDVERWNAFLFSLEREIGRASSIRGSFVRYDDRDSGYNQVLGLSAGGRGKNLGAYASWYASMSEGEGGDGTRGSLEISWYGKELMAGASASYLSPGYKASLGFVPYEPEKGISLWASCSKERIGIFGGNGSFGLDINGWNYKTYDGEDYMSGTWLGMYSGLQRGANQNYRINLGINSSRYKEFRDVYGSASFGLSFRYPNLLSFGAQVSGSYGERQEKEYIYLKPNIGITIGDNRLLVRYYLEFLKHGEERWQHVLWLNLNITPEHGIGSRLVLGKGKWNWYLSYRQGVRKGIDIYLILGDPNAEEFKKRVLAKLILPLL